MSEHMFFSLYINYRPPYRSGWSICRRAWEDWPLRYEARISLIRICYSTWYVLYECLMVSMFSWLGDRYYAVHYDCYSVLAIIRYSRYGLTALSRATRTSAVSPSFCKPLAHPYKGVTFKGIPGFPGNPFFVGIDKLLISQTISLSDGAKRNLDRRTDSTTSVYD